MDVINFLNGKGYKTISSDWYSRITEWRNWYAGKTKFHKYQIYNGKEHVSCTRKSLGMAKKVSEDKADLLLNEKVNICVGDSDGETKNAEQEFVDTILDANNFWVSGNELIEFTAAMGTGAFVEYLSGGEIKIDFIQASCIYPISWLNGRISECAFASVIGKTKEGLDITYVNIHVLVGGKYTVYNYYIEGEGKQMELPPEIVPEWKTGSSTPLFQIVKLNIANNIDTQCPMGISVYANALDVLESIDLVYDSYHNEFKQGKKRIFVNDTVLRVDMENGKTVPVFDANDTTFYGISGDSKDAASKAISESNMTLRTVEHQTGLQDNLDVLSDKVGFGKGYYKFSAEGVKTATEVISQNSKLFRKIKKDEIILEKVLTDMVRAILFLGKKNYQIDISINFDDSIIEDTDAVAKRALLELQAGAIDIVMYHMRVYKLTEVAAIKLVQEMENRVPPPTEMI